MPRRGDAAGWWKRRPAANLPAAERNAMPIDQTPFRLSRIYAQGWNAARQARLERAEADGVAAPYAADPERASWQRGFADGSA
jgi:hypothetical protein